MEQLGIVDQSLVVGCHGRLRLLCTGVQEERDDGNTAPGVKDIAMSPRVLHASLVTVETGVEAGQMVHVAAFLGQPPPILISGPSVMVRNRAEVHGGHVDHISVKIEEASVHVTLGIPGKLAVTMEVAAHDAVLDTLNEGAVSTDRLHVLGLIRMNHRHLNRFRCLPSAQFELRDLF